MMLDGDYDRPPQRRSKCIFLILTHTQNAAENTPRAVEWIQMYETSIIEILLECSNDCRSHLTLRWLALATRGITTAP